MSLAVIIGLAAALGPALTPFEPSDMRFDPISKPTWEHLLGINDGGQDILSELLYAVRNTMGFGLLCGVSALILGVGIGILSGWFGGWIDTLLMRLADILLAIPVVMILILTAALFRPDPWVLALVLAVLIWPTTGKAIRAQTLSLRRSLHVRAASRIGAGDFYILWRHILPEMFPLYLIGFAAKTRMAMFMEASLAFLGLFDPGRKSLGMMISYALNFYYLDIWWNWLMPPVLCLSLMIMCVTFLAISLEKIMDPRLKALTEEGV
jgi:peptide/nickel transport system permease protein